ncbi:transcriptional regulator [Streptomyces sp. F-3]|nr:transcriptional regulator [Streptomyces sp. F-3]
MGEDPGPFLAAGTGEPAPRSIADAGAVRARRPVITRGPFHAHGGGRPPGAGGGTGEEERIALLRTARDDSPRRTAV